MGKFSLDNFIGTMTYDNQTILDLSNFTFIDLYNNIKSSVANVRLVTDSYAGTPDLISYEEYGTVKYWWIICLANRISDPFKELYAGRYIAIPSLDSINSYYQQIQERTTNEVSYVNLS